MRYFSFIYHDWEQKDVSFTRLINILTLLGASDVRVRTNASKNFCCLSEIEKQKIERMSFPRIVPSFEFLISNLGGFFDFFLNPNYHLLVISIEVNHRFSCYEFMKRFSYEILKLIPSGYGYGDFFSSHEEALFFALGAEVLDVDDIDEFVLVETELDQWKSLLLSNSKNYLHDDIRKPFSGNLLNSLQIDKAGLSSLEGWNVETISDDKFLVFSTVLK